MKQYTNKWKFREYDSSKAEYLGCFDVSEDGKIFDVVKPIEDNTIRFGELNGYTMKEFGYIELEDGESFEDACDALHLDLEEFELNGDGAVCRMVYNDLL